MKFEMVDPSDWDDSANEYVETETSGVDSADRNADDPIQGLKADTARLISAVRMAARQVDECVAELADLAVPTGWEQTPRHDLTAVRPPADFHPARFGPRGDPMRPSSGGHRPMPPIRPTDR